MADPVTLSIAAIAGSSLLKAGSSLASGSSENRAAKSNAAAAESAGIENAARLRRQGRLNLGAIKAAAGASGLQLQGSVLDVLSDQAIEDELAALDARKSGMQAGLSERMRGRNAAVRGIFGAGTSLLSGAATIATLVDSAAAPGVSGSAASAPDSFARAGLL